MVGCCTAGLGLCSAEDAETAFDQLSLQVRERLWAACFGAGPGWFVAVACCWDAVVCGWDDESNAERSPAAITAVLVRRQERGKLQ